ncbi:MAG: DUF4411 family protein [Chitinispirillaceae bacterium]|nr:DUF4411 family protein [Chitinispirillaceae bacterium]
MLFNDKLKYILDANIFIEAANRYYSFDFGSRFWNFLVEKAKEGLLCSIDKVLKELQRGKKEDPLRKWAETDFKHYFFSTESNDILLSYSQIINLITESQNNQYNQYAIDDFLKEDNADAWVIAYAKHKNLIVVTHEKINPHSKKRVLIPNVCKELKIGCIDTFDMLRELRFTL